MEIKKGSFFQKTWRKLDLYRHFYKNEMNEILHLNAFPEVLHYSIVLIFNIRFRIAILLINLIKMSINLDPFFTIFADL